MPAERDHFKRTGLFSKHDFFLCALASWEGIEVSNHFKGIQNWWVFMDELLHVPQELSDATEMDHNKVHHTGRSPQWEEKSRWLGAFWGYFCLGGSKLSLVLGMICNKNLVGIPINQAVEWNAFLLASSPDASLKMCWTWWNFQIWIVGRRWLDLFPALEHEGGR